jgi:hypothetical protein
MGAHQYATVPISKVELLDELKDAAAKTVGAVDPGKRDEIIETIGTLTGALEKIVAHGHRADGIVRSMLRHSRGGSGDWRQGLGR